MAPSILLAEDDLSLLRLLGLALRGRGYRVTPARDGREAIELLSKGTYDCFVLDILMPGATGWEVLAHARELTPAGAPLPRVILVTGFQQEYVVDMHLLRREGAAGILLKPFDAETLSGEILRVLSLPREIHRPESQPV
jgi:CheY-like chemotaxis protein